MIPLAINESMQQEPSASNIDTIILRDIALELVNHSDWKAAMKNRSIFAKYVHNLTTGTSETTEKVISPMREMIVKMPGMSHDEPQLDEKQSFET